MPLMRIKKIRFFLTIALISITVIPLFSQFRDFRKATVIKSNGDSLAGKVSYKIKFFKSKTIFFKDSGQEQEISIDELDKVVFSNGETYTLIALEDKAAKKILAKTFIEGGVGLYQLNRFYYLKNDTSIYKLDDSKVRVTRDSKEFETLTKYLLTLNLAFIDCRTLNYQALAKRIRLKPLMNLVNEYSQCKDIPIRNIIQRPSTIEVTLLAGPSFIKLNATFIGEGGYFSSKASSYSISLLKDFGSSNRLKLRLDLDFIKSEMSGSGDYSVGSQDEVIMYSVENSGLRIPFGLQYYFFNNTSSFYVSGGLMFGVYKYEDMSAQGYIVTNANDQTIYVPTFQSDLPIESQVISGIWGSLGGDIRLTDKLKLNVELRGIHTKYKVLVPEYPQSEGMTINEFHPMVGLKYQIR